jgi:ribose transport system substrate-binding protein
VVAKLLNYKGSIIASTGISTMLNLNSRIEGVKQTLNKYPEMNLIEVRSSDGKPSIALSNIEAMVEEYPCIRGKIHSTI